MSSSDNTRLGKELEKLEREDPAVGEAARRLERVVDGILARKDVPKKRFHKSTPDAPCEPYTGETL